MVKRMKQTAHVSGYLRAIATSDGNNPLQTKLQLILTDYEPNKNKQGVSKAEAENIMRSAIGQPLKVNFDGHGINGHTGAVAVGPIMRTWEMQDNGREVIAAEAIIWNEYFGAVAEHIKDAFADGVGTSWEIYYDSAEVDSDGVEWLQNCLFAGTCIVDTPAYGPQRTRLLAVAEELKKHESEKVMSKKVEETTTDEVTTEEKVAEAEIEATETEQARSDVLDAQELLWQLYEGLDALYAKTFEIEVANAERNLETVANQFADRIAKLAERMSAMATEKEMALAELNSVKAEKAQAEAAAARTEMLNTRRSALAEVGVVLSDEEFTNRTGMIEGMSEDMFSQYVADLSAMATKKSVAEVKKPIVPEPSGERATFSPKELGAALLNEIKR